MRRSLLVPCLVLGVSVLASCGGPAATGDSLGDDTSGDENPQVVHHNRARELIGINPPERPWSEMSHEDREMDMVGRFLPIMGEVFQEHDATRYQNFACESCHGSDMRERNFAMPSPRLPAVPMAGTPEYQTLATAAPEAVRFMEEHVTPPMQTMLGMGATFTCNGCHPLPGQAAR